LSKKLTLTQTNTSSAVAATRTYDAFGNVTSSTGTWKGAFGYAGDFGYQEDASGLKLLGHRYYDSSTGRFLTRDPAKDGRNWYAYCENDSINRIDPSGLNWVLKIGKHTWIVIKKGGGTIKNYIRKNYPERDIRIHRSEEGLPSPHGHAVEPPPVPGGWYPEDDVSKIHITTEAAADNATHPDWIDWRKNIIGGIIAFFFSGPFKDMKDFLEENIFPPITDFVKNHSRRRIRNLMAYESST
jgi:RHS repeat-associated protein